MSQPAGGNLKIRDDELSWRRVGDEIIVLDLRENSYLSINESGTILWEMLVEGTTRESMTARLVTSFALGETRARADIDQFVTMLIDRRLLV